MASGKIRVLLADDHQLFREMLYHALSEEEDLEIVGEATNGQEVLEKIRQLKPDVVLLDIEMPKMNGIEASRHIKQESEQTRIVVLTAYDEDEFVFQLVRAGASGYLLKDSSLQDVVRAIRAAYSGESLIQPKVISKILKEFVKMAEAKNDAIPASPPSQELKELTQREMEVIKQVARGLNNREIAEKLFISEPTVKSHISSIMRKLNLRDRVEMVLFAVQNRLIEPEPKTN